MSPKINHTQLFPEMESLFDDWNTLKKELQEKERSNIRFKEWDIWWVSIGQNIRSESYWKWENYRRPVLIVRKLSKESCICIPLSSKIKTWTWFCEYKHQWERATALLYQIKMIHINRFQRRLWYMDDSDFKNIKKRLKELLNL